MVFKLEVLDAFNDAGTFGAFGFLGGYFLISLAAPAYLKRAGILRGRDIALSRSLRCFTADAAIGSVYPVSSWPVNIFPYIFVGYVLIGMGVVYDAPVAEFGTIPNRYVRPFYGEHAPSAGAEMTLKPVQSSVTAA